LKYLRSTTLGYGDIGVRKSEFVVKIPLTELRPNFKNLSRGLNLRRGSKMVGLI